MTRTYAAVRLLEHGPLTLGDFIEITGWKPNRANNVLRRLRSQGMVKRTNDGRRRCYQVVA